MNAMGLYALKINLFTKPYSMSRTSWQFRNKIRIYQCTKIIQEKFKYFKAWITRNPDLNCIESGPNFLGYPTYTYTWRRPEDTTTKFYAENKQGENIILITFICQISLYFISYILFPFLKEGFKFVAILILF